MDLLSLRGYIERRMDRPADICRDQDTYDLVIALASAIDSAQSHEEAHGIHYTRDALLSHNVWSELIKWTR